MIVDDLAKQGYSVQQDFLSTNEVKNLLIDFNRSLDDGLFSAASVGNKLKATLDPGIRSDKIFWLDTKACSGAQAVLFKKLEALRLECNQSLYLGLLDVEGHYAFYAEKALYQKHLDAFRDDDSRVLSVILYLNENWQKGDGGELLLHTAEPQKVEPRAGTLVVFLSNKIEHEVLESHKPRKSFAAWFKKRPV